MNKNLSLILLLACVAVGSTFIVSSQAEDNDDGSVACLNGPAGTVVAGNGSEADGMVYDATKARKNDAKATDCTASISSGETEDEDGDSD
jgi:hypothetical protein